MDDNELRTYLMSLVTLNSFIIGNLIMIDKYLSGQDPLAAIMFHDFETVGRDLLANKCLPIAEEYLKKEEEDDA